MSKTVHIHVGAHLSGSVSGQIAHFADHLLVHHGLTCLSQSTSDSVATALGADDPATARTLTKLLLPDIEDAPGDCLVSCENLAGELPGSSGKRRIYPRLFRNLNLMRQTLSPYRTRFYIVLPEPNAFLQHAYDQHLRLRTRFGSFGAFSKFLRTNDIWDVCLAKSREKLGADLVELKASGNAASDVLTAILGVQPSFSDVPAVIEQTNAPMEIFAVLNRGPASANAKQNAKAFLIKPNTAEPKRVELDQGSQWPSAPKQPDWLDPALARLWSRVERRVSAQDQPNLLPKPDADLSPHRTRLVVAPDAALDAGRGRMEDQRNILAYRFRDLPETALLLGLSISYLRRDTAHTAAAMHLHQRLWAEEYPILLGVLPTRWLISALQTFMDHGTTEAQRQAGAAAYFMANTLKLYEAERAIEGLAPDATYPGTTPQTRAGFRGLDRFDVGGTDLMVNSNALLLELAARDPISGRVVQEFMLRLKRANTAFSRMDQNRVAHDVVNPQFANCWSFFDPPESK